jgi:hypothetical protein
VDSVAVAERGADRRCRRADRGADRTHQPAAVRHVPGLRIRTTIGTGSSNRQFNAEWLRIRVAVPSDHTRTVGLNPQLSVDSCWWGIRYAFDGSIHDVTTWQARSEGATRCT